MMRGELNSKQTPSSRRRRDANGGGESFAFSPGFRSVAAMAGWDEESIMIASLTVEDTPERDQITSSKRRRRSIFTPKAPSSTESIRKTRTSGRNQIAVLTPILNLDEGESGHEGGGKKVENETTKENEKACVAAIPCLDKLREELSCAVCLEICFEPSTTSCGHSFCKKCLRIAAEKCGKKCPKCREVISNGRSCTVNTVLWNTIQLLFPKEVEARKEAADEGKKEEKSARQLRRLRRVRDLEYRTESVGMGSGGRVEPDADAALALRLQREEFMEAFQGGTSNAQSYNATISRHRLRTMAATVVRRRIEEAINARALRAHRRSH